MRVKPAGEGWWVALCSATLDRRQDAAHGCTAPHPTRPRTAPPHLPPPPPLVLVLLLVLLLDSSASPPTNRPSVRTRTHTHRAAPHPARARRQAARGAGHQTRTVPQPTLGRPGAPSQGQAEPRRVARRLAQPRKAPPGTTTLVRLARLSPTRARCRELTRVEGGDCAARDRVKQASRGYFHDYNELRQQGGKAFVAPKTLIREDVRPLALVRRTFATALDRPDPAPTAPTARALLSRHRGRVARDQGQGAHDGPLRGQGQPRRL